MPLSSIRLIGRHLVADVMAAATVAQIAGVPMDAMVRAVESFTGLEHALEPVAVVNGVRFVNDSKATNVEAAQRAIESFDGGLVVIMGGRFKSGDFSLLREPLRARNAKVVAIGEAAPLIERALEGAVPVERLATLEAAVSTDTTWRGLRSRGGACQRGSASGAPAVGEEARDGKSCCSRRRARASTCSAITRSAVEVFKKEVLRLMEENDVARAVNSRQSAWRGRELAAGNTGCPGL